MIDPTDSMDEIKQGFEKATKPIPLPENFEEEMRRSPAVEKMVDAMLGRQAGITKQVDILLEALDYLRVVTKYLLFDVEATRRERDDYKAMLTKEDDQIG